MHCEWDEHHASSLEGLAAQKRHLREAHGLSPESPKKHRRKHGSGHPTPGETNPDTQHL